MAMPDQGFRWTTFELGTSCLIEVIDPLEGDGFLQRFLEKRGEGPHHVTIQVDDIARVMAVLEEKGIEMFGYSEALSGWKEVFVHPKQAFGTLIQFAEFNPLDWGERGASALGLPGILSAREGRPWGNHRPHEIFKRRIVRRNQAGRPDGERIQGPAERPDIASAIHLKVIVGRAIRRNSARFGPRSEIRVLFPRKGLPNSPLVDLSDARLGDFLYDLYAFGRGPLGKRPRPRRIP